MSAGMRPRTLLSDVIEDTRTLMRPTNPSNPSNPSNHDTYERVRRTLDEAIAELQLPVIDRDDTARLIKLYQPAR
jgi:hypothetical protein